MPVSTFLNGRAPTRGVLWLGLSDTGGVLLRAGTADGGGAQTYTYTRQGTISCRIDPLGGREGEQAVRVSDRSTHVVTLPALTTITLDDDFVVDGRGTFEVTAIRSRTGEFARMIEVTDKT
jgi:YD repeat-containing protein